VRASFQVKTSDFGISTPSFAGLTMAEAVDVSVQANAALRPASKPL
jgi:hypothetical protein